MLRALTSLRTALLGSLSSNSSSFGSKASKFFSVRGVASKAAAGEDGAAATDQVNVVGEDPVAASNVDDAGDVTDDVGQLAAQRHPYSTEVLSKLALDKYPFYVEREWWKDGKRMTFWSTWRMRKDIWRRQAVAEHAPDRVRHKAIKFNTVLPQAIRDEAAEVMDKLPRYSHPKLVLYMCQFTGKRRGKLRKWRLGRHVFRRLADHGQLSGVQRAMW